MKNIVLTFSALIIALLSLFKLSKYAYISGDLSIEVVIAIIAVIFFFIGVYMSRKSTSNTISEAGSVDEQKIAQLGLSKREYEVLLEISKGLSNKEIAKQLFLSESTIKTHVSNILVKLDAKRRTQAIQKAKTLRVIPN